MNLRPQFLVAVSRRIMGFKIVTGVLALVAAVSAYPVTYVQPGPQHGQQTVSPQQYRVLLQQAQPQVGAALSGQPIYQTQPQSSPQSVIYQQQPQPQQPQQYVVPRLKPRPLPPQQAPGQVQQEQEDYDHNPQYQFGFDVRDDEFTNYQNRKEQREGNKISGSYSVVDSDGFIRTVKYTADPLEGFKAQVTREPTNIVVKIPQPQPQPEHAQQYITRPAPAPGQSPARQPYAQVYSSVASQPSPEQLSQLRALARQQFGSSPQPHSAAAASAPVQYQGVQPQIQYAPQPQPSRPKSIKAGPLGYAAQQPAGQQVIYQAYQQ